MKSGALTSQPFVLDLKAGADLRAKLKDDPQGGLKQVAKQFEGLLLQMMLKSMREASPQDGPMDSDQTRFFTSIMDQQLAQNLAGQGKLGFAKLIEQQLGRNQGAGAPLDPARPLEALQQSLGARQAANSAGVYGSSAGSNAGSAGANARSGTGAERVRSAPAAALGSPGGNNGFVNRIWPHVLEAARAIGVPPQFLVAHSALESGWGKSEIRTADGAPSFNIFGIKAGRNWQGASVDVPTTEYVNGVAQSVREKFRVYGSYAEAFRDYANLLRNNTRFSDVLGQQDGGQFARSLQQSGYATDPAYADKLSRIINGTTLRQSLLG